jgi:RNA polymerase-interacting CarD/CdnL/TRCF family regulator
MRASDEDRDRVAALLQEHHAEGRLTAEEFDERVNAALAARTIGELDELLADLPHVDRRRYQLPDAGINPHPERL